MNIKEYRKGVYKTDLKFESEEAFLGWINAGGVQSNNKKLIDEIVEDFQQTGTIKSFVQCYIGDTEYLIVIRPKYQGLPMDWKYYLNIEPVTMGVIRNCSNAEERRGLMYKYGMHNFKDQMKKISEDNYGVLYEFAHKEDDDVQLYCEVFNGTKAKWIDPKTNESFTENKKAADGFNEVDDDIMEELGYLKVDKLSKKEYAKYGLDPYGKKIYFIPVPRVYDFIDILKHFELGNFRKNMEDRLKIIFKRQVNDLSSADLSFITYVEGLEGIIRTEKEIKTPLLAVAYSFDRDPNFVKASGFDYET